MESKPRTAKGEKDMVTTTVSLEREAYKALRHLAVDQDSTVRDLIREAVAEFLRKKGSRR